MLANAADFAVVKLWQPALDLSESLPSGNFDVAVYRPNGRSASGGLVVGHASVGRRDVWVNSTDTVLIEWISSFSSDTYTDAPDDE